jgi:hypothetical protein
MNEYAGRKAALRLIDVCERALNVPVMAWGYRNNARADPKASDEYAR